MDQNTFLVLHLSSDDLIVSIIILSNTKNVNLNCKYFQKKLSGFLTKKTWNLIIYNYTKVSYKNDIHAISAAKNNSIIDHLCYDIFAYYALYLDDNKNKNEVPLQVLRRVYITI